MLSRYLHNTAYNFFFFGLRPKVYNSILGNIYSIIKGINSNINSLLLIDRRTNKKVKLDTRIVSKILCELYIE